MDVELDCEESWASKNWCFWTVVLEKTLESPLDCKDIQPVHSKGDQSWVFFGRKDAKAETPVLWPPHAKGWLIGKDSDAGGDWGQEEKGMTEHEMAGWHHQLNGVWVNSGSWWWTDRPGMLQFMELQRVEHDWVTDLNWGKTGPWHSWLSGTALCESSWLLVVGSRSLRRWLEGQGRPQLVPAYCLVGLGPCKDIHLAWEVPRLVPASWWVGKHIVLMGKREFYKCIRPSLIWMELTISIARRNFTNSSSYQINWSG